MNFFHVDSLPYEYLSVAELAEMVNNCVAAMLQRSLDNEEIVMASNPFSPLVRMLEQRIARQELALSESKLQLDSAKIAHADHEDGGKTAEQVDFIAKPGKRTPVST